MFVGARCALAAAVHPAGSQAANLGSSRGSCAAAMGFGRAMGSDLPRDWQRYVARAVRAGQTFCSGSSGGSHLTLHAGAASAHGAARANCPEQLVYSRDVLGCSPVFLGSLPAVFLCGCLKLAFICDVRTTTLSVSSLMSGIMLELTEQPLCSPLPDYLYSSCLWEYRLFQPLVLTSCNWPWE